MEFNPKNITLKHVGPFVTYCKIASPEYALLVSPEGLSDSLGSLFKTFGCYDLLEYRKNKRIIIAKWDIKRKDLDYASILPPSELR